MRELISRLGGRFGYRTATAALTFATGSPGNDVGRCLTMLQLSLRQRPQAAALRLELMGRAPQQGRREGGHADGAEKGRGGAGRGQSESHEGRGVRAPVTRTVTWRACPRPCQWERGAGLAEGHGQVTVGAGQVTWGAGRAPRLRVTQAGRGHPVDHLPDPARWGWRWGGRVDSEEQLQCASLGHNK